MNFLGFDPSLEFFSYLVIALLLGSTIGLERTLAHKTAGLRTFGLVSMGSCLFILIVRSMLPELDALGIEASMRVAAGIIMGIGFLGGGVIVFKDSTLTGLTTAAGLWVAAGIGMAVGYGLVLLALFATMTTLLVFIVMWFVEKRLVSKKG